MKVDPYLTPAYAGNVYGATDNLNFAFKPNLPSGLYPLMGNDNYYFSSSPAATILANANVYASPQQGTNWANNTSYVYSGTINIPKVTNNSGANYISFLNVIRTPLPGPVHRRAPGFRQATSDDGVLYDPLANGE